MPDAPSSPNRTSILGWVKNLKRSAIASNESVNTLSDTDAERSPQRVPFAPPESHELLRPILNHKSRSTNNVHRHRSESTDPSMSADSLQLRQHRDSFLQHHALVDGNSQYFGVPLEAAIDRASIKISIMAPDPHAPGMPHYGRIPIVVAKCGVFLKKNGLAVEGIFRVGGSSKRIRELQAEFNTPPDFGRKLDWDGYNVHDAASVLRRYLNALPEPLVPLELYEDFRDPLRSRSRIIKFMKYRAENPRKKAAASQPVPTIVEPDNAANEESAPPPKTGEADCETPDPTDPGVVSAGFQTVTGAAGTAIASVSSTGNAADSGAGDKADKAGEADSDKAENAVSDKAGEAVSDKAGEAVSDKAGEAVSDKADPDKSDDKPTAAQPAPPPVSLTPPPKDSAAENPATDTKDSPADGRRTYKKLATDVYAAIDDYKHLLDELPGLSRQLLFYILDLLSMVQNNSDENLMSARNLAAIFQPSILSHPNHDMDPDEYALSQSVVEFLIQYAYKLLPSEQASVPPKSPQPEQLSSSDHTPKRTHSKSLSNANHDYLDMIGYHTLVKSTRGMTVSDTEHDFGSASSDDEVVSELSHSLPKPSAAPNLMGIINADASPTRH